MKRNLPLVLLVGVTLHAPAQAPTPRSKSSTPDARDLVVFQSATQDFRAGHLEAAIRGFTQVTQDAPGFAEGYLNLGLAYAGESSNEQAVAALSKAIELKPTLRGAHLFEAISLYKLTRFEPAAAAIRKETELDPKDAQAWMWQGIIDLALQRLAPAVEELDRAASLDSKNVDILYHRGRAALALSRQSYEDMFSLDPSSWHVHQVLAEADIESNRDVDAVEQYRLAIASAPPQSGLYEALGSALWRTGKFDEAAQAYEAALKIDPGDTLTQYKLGCLRIDRGDAAGGKPLLEKAMAADPSLKLGRYYLGRAQAQLGEDQAAIANFKQVISEDLDSDTTKQAYFQLSRAYRRVHDTPGAAEAQARYRALDQASKDALQEKVSRQRQRADRDTSIPPPASDTAQEP